MTASTATIQHRPPLLIRVLTPLIRLLLRSPLHSLVSKRVMLLTFTGRKSGQPFSTPVGYAQVDERTILTGTYNRWWKNLRGGAPVTLRVGGQERRAIGEPITDVDGMLEAYRAIAAASPAYIKDLTKGGGPRLTGNPQADHAEIERARREGFLAVRFRLA